MIYDWKSLGIWLNSVWRAQIEGLYSQIMSVMVALNGCCLVCVCLHWPMTWILCVCVLMERGRELHFSQFCPALSGTWRKSSACAPGTMGRPWVPVFAVVPVYLLYSPLSFSYILCLMCAGYFHGLEKSSIFICEEFRRTSFPMYPADRDNRILIFVAS